MAIRLVDVDSWILLKDGFSCVHQWAGSGHQNCSKIFGHNSPSLNRKNDLKILDDIAKAVLQAYQPDLCSDSWLSRCPNSLV